MCYSANHIFKIVMLYELQMDRDSDQDNTSDSNLEPIPKKQKL